MCASFVALVNVASDADINPSVLATPKTKPFLGSRCGREVGSIRAAQEWRVFAGGMFVFGFCDRVVMVKVTSCGQLWCGRRTAKSCLHGRRAMAKSAGKDFRDGAMVPFE